MLRLRYAGLNRGARHRFASWLCSGVRGHTGPAALLTTTSGATLCTTDRDFARFEGLAWINPLETV